MTGVWQLFDKIMKLGEGSFGSVYLARDKADKKFYAVKVLKNQAPKYEYMDIPYTSLREVSILKDIDHENIVKYTQLIRLLRVYFDHHSFAMIFEYQPMNLVAFMNARRTVSDNYLEECRNLMQGILKGVDYLHSRGVYRVFIRFSTET